MTVDALRSPAPARGGWRGREGYEVLSRLLAQHSRFKIVPEADSPLKWVANSLCSGASARDSKLPLYCTVCGDRPPAATMGNLLNARNGTPYSCACSCVYRPVHATAEGYAQLARIAEASQCTLVVPEGEWVAAHLSKSTRWQLVEVQCSLCSKTRLISNQNILKNPTFKPQCPCRPPVKRTRRSKKKKQQETERASSAEAGAGAGGGAGEGEEAERTARHTPCRPRPPTPRPRAAPPLPPLPTTTTTTASTGGGRPSATARPAVASSTGSSGMCGTSPAHPTTMTTNAKRPRARKWSDSEMSSEEEGDE